MNVKDKLLLFCKTCFALFQCLRMKIMCTKISPNSYLFFLKHSSSHDILCCIYVVKLNKNLLIYCQLLL